MIAPADKPPIEVPEPLPPVPDEVIRLVAAMLLAAADAELAEAGAESEN